MVQLRRRPAQHRSSWPDRLERTALLIVLGVVCARAMVQERPDYEQLHVVHRLQGIPDHLGGPGPATSLVFDGLILVAAAACAVAAAIRGQWRYRAGGVELALLLMIVAAALSFTAAGNLRLAVNESIDRLAAVVVLLIVARTVRRWWQARAVLAAVGATGVAFAAFCISQVYEQEDTRRWIEQQKDQAIRSGRISPDDPMLRLLEARAGAGEASGFFAHSNIAGSFLMVSGLATIALGVARLRAPRRTFSVLFGGVTLLAAALMAVGLGLTHSRGAIVAGMLLGSCWLVVGLAWGRWARLRALVVQYRYRLLTAGWTAVAAIALATVLVGLYRGSLPGDSLAYRWQYWTGAARIIAEHPWTGVGAGNFDRFYVRHKPVEAPEEVKDPHNYLVTTATAWGMLGLSAAVVLLVAVSIALCRPTQQRPSESDDRDDGHGSSEGGVIALWLLPLSAGVLVVRSVATPGQLWLIWALVPTVIWMIAYLSLSLDSDQPLRFENGPLMLSGGLAAALLAAALHNTISFSMVYPGSACMFFALAGLAIAVRRMGGVSSDAAAPAGPGETNSKPAGSRQVWLLVVAAGLVAASVAYWPVVVGPVSTSTRHLTQARRTPLTSEALDAYRRAVQADPLDPVAPAELASWAIRHAQRVPGNDPNLAAIAVANALTAVRRDPEDNRHFRTLASAYVVRYAALGDPNDADRAAAAAAKAVQLYPELPILRVDYGEMLVLQGAARRSRALSARGVDQMRLALQLDDRRPGERIRRFRAAHRDRIMARIRELESRPVPMSRPATTSAPREIRPPIRQGG